jgi:5'-nucleotidase
MQHASWNRPLAAVALLLAALVPFPGHAIAQPGDVHLTLLQVNDVYQSLPVDRGQHGGLARLATLRRKIASESPNTVLCLGGDTLSPSVASNFFKGKQMIATWNATGLDLAVYGNHEFDFGPEVLAQRVKESRFTWLSTNAVDARTGEPFGGAKRYAIREFDGVKVGFIGLLTPTTAVSSKPGPGVKFLDPIDAARKAKAELATKGVNTVVAITHLAMSEDKALAQAVPVDIILGGHEHAPMQAVSNGTPIMKMGSDARLLGRFDLHVSRKTGKTTSLDIEVSPITSETPEDPATAKVAAEYEDQLSAAFGQPVGSTTAVLDALQATNRTRETNIGDLITDAYRAYAKTDVALVNGGAIRSNSTYGPGPLTRKDIVAIFPFEKPILAAEIPGKTLRAAIEHGLSKIVEDREEGRFAQVSGMTYKFDGRRPAGSRLVEITVGGKPLDDAKLYTLAAEEYILNGGDGYSVLKGLKLVRKPEDAGVAAAILIDYIGGKEIAPATDGRIQRVDQ